MPVGEFEKAVFQVEDICGHLRYQLLADFHEMIADMEERMDGVDCPLRVAWEIEEKLNFDITSGMGKPILRGSVKAVMTDSRNKTVCCRLVKPSASGFPLAVDPVPP